MCAASAPLTGQPHAGQAEFAFLVVPVRVEDGRLAHQELRHVVQPKLVEVVAAHHEQDVRLGSGERGPERLDFRYPLVGEGRAFGAGRGARAVVEGVRNCWRV